MRDQYLQLLYLGQTNIAEKTHRWGYYICIYTIRISWGVCVFTVYRGFKPIFNVLLWMASRKHTWLGLTA
jgi:hypothetical protein